MGKISFIFISNLLIISYLSAKNDSLDYQGQKLPLVKKIVYQDYEILTYQAPKPAENSLTMPKVLSVKFYEREVYQVGVASNYWLKLETRPDSSFIFDLNNDGVEELIIEEYSGGAHCCTQWHILSLGDEFKIMAKLNAQDGDFKLQDVNNDRIFEIITADFGFAYWNASFSECSPPSVVLAYQNGQYQPATALMQKKPNQRKLRAETNEIRKKINLVLTQMTDLEAIKQASAGERWSFLSPQALDYDLWQILLELTFSGNRARARQLVREVFPERLQPYQDLFWADFEAQLQKCTYLPSGF
ncbi:MAG: hypothetical protein MUE85_11730 [Microscillaceae bacterium]|jgi:hypothetical protein|nr:hypothetical protein [Microscillaceae bacterium]